MTDSAALLKRARDLFQQGLQGQAEEVVDRILRDNPHDATALDFRGYLLYRKGNLDDALAAYRRLAELEPALPAHRANLGLICFKAQRYRDALLAFQQLHEMQPEDPKTLRNLGSCHERLGDLQRALGCFTRAGDGKQAERIRGQLARTAAVATDPALELRVDAATGTTPCAEERDAAAWVAGVSCPRPGKNPDLVRTGPGELMVKVREKVFVNPAFCVGHRGVVVFAPASREAEKAGARYGDRHGVLARIEGNGELALSGRGRALHALHLSGGRLFVNWGSLVLCGNGITLAFGDAGLIKEAFLSTGIEGTGTVVLALRGTPIAFSVAPDLPALVRPEAVVAWTDGLGYETETVSDLKKLLGKREALRYRFEGKGHLVLQSC